MGEAYGFFDCSASKEQIKAELPDIRDDARTPHSLELLLIEGPENLKGDERLMRIAQLAVNARLKYVLHAKLPEEPNRRVSNELADIMNSLYRSPLCDPNEPFRAEVVHEENGEYVRHE